MTMQDRKRDLTAGAVDREAQGCARADTKADDILSTFAVPDGDEGSSTRSAA